MEQRQIYNTDDEIAFLNSFGRNARDPKARVQRLRDYLDSMNNRTKWGHIDPKIVRNHVYKMIAETGIKVG